MNNNMTKLTQSERLAKVEEKTDGINHKIDKLDGKIDTMIDKLDGKIDTMIDKLDGKTDTMIDKLDEKYASKWVESAMSKLIATVCLVVLGALLALVIVNK